MEDAKIRIEVFYKVKDYRGEAIKHSLERFNLKIKNIYISNNYLFNTDLHKDEIKRIADALVQPVTQSYVVNNPYIPAKFSYAFEIGFLPGVTDNEAHTVREMAGDTLKKELDPEKSVFTTITYYIDGNISRGDIEKIGMQFYNPLIQRIKILSREEYLSGSGMGFGIPVVHIHERPEADEVSFDLPDEDLARIGKEGIPEKDGARRGPLALDMMSLCTIKDYFNNKERRNPTDIELESIAQTWSEHCKHTIFAAKLDDVEEGVFRRYIKAATDEIRKKKGEMDFCVSVFKDNSGGILFDENYIISDKVETHNSPSALDPFGGSVTGIVGVNRDAMGFGMGAKPIANRYGFCFADPFDERPLFRAKSNESRLLLPRRIMEGVIHGVNVGGNQSGIPTPQGFIYFDERYKGKPLVFVGTIGLIPRTVASGASSVEKNAMPGDYIVMAGGRVGRDGIHGATFSSEALDSGSPATAVQIGDPITQKKLSDAIVKEARDKGLYHSITDNGAGGLSCSVAEMAKECGGFEVDLDRIPLKYPGLAPWQIWISESQERMTLSVPGNKLDEFIELMKRRDVEATVIGRFNDSGRGIVKYNGEIVFDLDLDFLHDGLPQKSLKTFPRAVEKETFEFPEPEIMSRVFNEMTGRLNTASFEFISSQYDHEVQASSVIKPLHGKGRINGNVSVIRPVLDSYRGVVLSHGLYPSYCDDPYRMAACSIDTAVRNAVSVGGSTAKLALLDNFCWCDSTNPERLYQLKEAARACYDYALDYETPYISGKDSMFNDFKGYDENFNEVFISVPPTLLISSIGIIEDVRKCQTMDFKCKGDIIYIIGMTYDELGGSEYIAYMQEIMSVSRFVAGDIPSVNAGVNMAVYRAFEKALENRIISSSISIERGGLGLALARSSMAGMLGFDIDLSCVPGGKDLRNDTILYSESQGRFLISIDPSMTDEFENNFHGMPAARIGTVGEREIKISSQKKNIVKSDVGTLLNIHKGVFKDF